MKETRRLMPARSAFATEGLPRRLAEIVWHVKGVADGLPDGLHVLAIGQGLVDGAPADTGENVVPGHAGRIGLTELEVHPVPEYGQPHRARLPGPRGTAASSPRVALCKFPAWLPYRRPCSIRSARSDELPGSPGRELARSLARAPPEPALAMRTGQRSWARSLAQALRSRHSRCGGMGGFA